MKSKEWLTTQEAAERHGVTTARIRQMVVENQLTARIMGSKYRGQWQVKANEYRKAFTRERSNPIYARQKSNDPQSDCGKS